MSTEPMSKHRAKGQWQWPRAPEIARKSTDADRMRRTARSARKAQSGSCARPAEVHDLAIVAGPSKISVRWRTYRVRRPSFTLALGISDRFDRWECAPGY